MVYSCGVVVGSSSKPIEISSTPKVSAMKPQDAPRKNNIKKEPSESSSLKKLKFDLIDEHSVYFYLKKHLPYMKVKKAGTYSWKVTGNNKIYGKFIFIITSYNKEVAFAESVSINGIKNSNYFKIQKFIDGLRAFDE